MKVSREQAAENRERVIEVASRLFREHGLDGIGIADVMKAAGLTHGGFYGQFRSKDDLIEQACAHALARSARGWQKAADEAEGDALGALVARYVSPRHRDNPATGCAFSTVAAGAARHGGGLRKVLTEGLKPLVDTLTKVVPGSSRAARRRKALAAMSQMLGAIILARVVDDGALSIEILEAVRADLAGKAALH
jgi:TetR/AcrR family transcriptional repressor of nem operon